MKQKNKGSSFASWLREEGIYEEVTGTAINLNPAVGTVEESQRA